MCHSCCKEGIFLREPLLSCWNGSEWTVQVRDFIFIPRDLLASESGFWSVGEGLSSNEDSFGDLVYVPNTLPFNSHHLTEPESLPPFNFIAKRSSDHLFLSSSRVNTINSILDSKLRIRTSVVSIHLEGDKLEEATFLAINTFTYPTGILALENSLLAADFLDNSISEISLEGERLNTYSGLKGPMGIKQAPNGDICIAEYLGGQISCFTLETLRGN